MRVSSKVHGMEGTMEVRWIGYLVRLIVAVQNYRLGADCHSAIFVNC